jgi:nitrite reductase/ring-hydroxylating ferredoxin subunit
MSSKGINTPGERKVEWGSGDAGQYFRYMSEFVGFGSQEADAIQATHLIVEKYIPQIVGQFYTKLLGYPPTRKVFSKNDGSINQDYLQLRMHHLTNFLRRTAAGIYDDDYARFIDYVGRAHTTHGADPKIYIPERYVIGQIGLIQHAISDALHKELNEVDPELEDRASRAWNLLLMVILEMLARTYSDEHAAEGEGTQATIDKGTVHQLAVQIYERNLGMYRSIERKEVKIGSAADIPEGERKIVDVEGVSIGVFHYKGSWYALRNSCVHRSGPVCTGSLIDGVLTCPWHGYQYRISTGEFLLDSTAKLEMYPVEIRDGDIYLKVSFMVMDSPTVELEPAGTAEKTQPVSGVASERPSLKGNEFWAADLPPGQIGLVLVDGEEVAVFNVAGMFYATHNYCTHADGPLNEGYLEDYGVVCPWHDSCFDVRDGRVLRGPATEPVKAYRVVVEDGIGRIE